eukprot:scaffold789_cov261-Pinguiococcus_pyrenoidosus.AAC.4
MATPSMMASSGRSRGAGERPPLAPPSQYSPKRPAKQSQPPESARHLPPLLQVTPSRSQRTPLDVR